MWIFRWYVFYPLAALIAVGVVLASFGPALLPETGPQPTIGRIAQGALVIEGESLAYPQASANTVFFVPRDANWRPAGLRVAIKPNSGPVVAGEKGAQILLAPEAAQWFGAGPLRVEVTTLPLPLAGASQLAFGLLRGDAMEWRTKTVSPIRDTLVFEFAGEPGPVHSLAIRPISQDDAGNRGVEIRSIRVMRAPAQPAAAMPPPPTPLPEILEPNPPADQPPPG